MVVKSLTDGEEGSEDVFQLVDPYEILEGTGHIARVISFDCFDGGCRRCARHGV